VPSRRAFLLAFVAYFLLGAAWALSMPANGTYDEKQHLVRAYEVWKGELVPTHRSQDAAGRPSDATIGPRSLLPENPDCTWNPRPPKPASCQVITDDRTEDVIPTTAGRYSPVYYFLVGLPLKISPDMTGLIWARMLSALIGALILAFATAIASQMGHRLLLPAIVLVGTPLAMNLNGSINPNGIEISSAVLLFVSLLAALQGPTRAMIVTAGVSLLILVTSLHLGIVMGGLAVLACALVAGWQKTKAFVRNRDALLWFGGLGLLSVVFALGWLRFSAVTDITPPPDTAGTLDTSGFVKELVTTRAEFWARQVVAQFGYGETTVSIGVIALWYLLVALLVVPALWYATNRVRLAIVGMFLACVAMLVALEVHFYSIVGWYAHSRYVMPLGAGILLVAATVRPLEHTLRDRRRLDRFVLLPVLVTIPIDVYVLARVMTRYQRGIDAGLNPFGGSWQPSVGSVAPLAGCLVGGLLLAVIVKSPSVRGVSELSTSNTLSN
jgi:hypothetical protein